ncbi:MAG: NUDIX domain-containing protein [Solirubrobacterales bacterium]|nr:NUDIX domain-containing protein [Solirubrobacterales bacterium]
MAKVFQKTEAVPAEEPEEFSYGGVVVRGDKIVVTVPIKRSQDGSKVLALPKGHAESGETPQEAALREVREEAGVKGKLGPEIGHVTYHYERKKKMRYKQVTFYLIEYRSGDPDDHDHEMEDAYWLSFDKAIKRLTYKGEREIVVRAQKMAKKLT